MGKTVTKWEKLSGRIGKLVIKWEHLTKSVKLATKWEKYSVHSERKACGMKDIPDLYASYFD
jgi:hypothetical protein